MTEGTTLADKLHPNWSLARSWAGGGGGCKEQAAPGEESRGSSKKGWAKGGCMTVFCCPRDYSESAWPMNLLVANSTRSPYTGTLGLKL